MFVLIAINCLRCWCHRTKHPLRLWAHTWQLGRAKSVCWYVCTSSMTRELRVRFGFNVPRVCAVDKVCTRMHHTQKYTCINRYKMAATYACSARRPPPPYRLGYLSLAFSLILHALFQERNETYSTICKDLNLDGNRHGHTGRTPLLRRNPDSDDNLAPHLL